MGWVPGSNMAKVYVHLSGRDPDTAILKAHGIDVREGEVEKVDLPKPCPRCDTSNPSNARYCRNCGLPLDVETAVDIDKTRERLLRVMSGLASDPRFQRLLNQAMNEQAKRRF